MLYKFFLVFFSFCFSSFGFSNSSLDQKNVNGSPYKNSSFEIKDNSVLVKHNFGEVLIKQNPQKIVTFDLAVADILREVGIEVTALPKQTLPPYLDSFNDNKYINAGSMKEADFEKISELNPDLVIVSGRMANQVNELSKIAPTLFVVSHASNYFNALSNNVELFKAIFPDKAHVFDIKLKTLIERSQFIKDRVLKNNLKSLTIMTNDGKIAAFGVGSRYGIINEAFGFQSVYASDSKSTHGNQINFEYINKVNPDYIFVVDRSAAIGVAKGGAQKLLDNDLVNATKAAKNGKIVYLSSDIWYLAAGGFQSTDIMIGEIEASLD